MKPLLLFMLPAFLPLPRAAEKPNVIVILADDLGYGDVAAYNPDSRIPTPHLDRLAQEGIRFTDAHAPSSVCTPTRYALLTGRLAWRSPLKRGVLGPWDQPLIEKSRLTLPAFLQHHGYRTSAIGKWHLGWTWPTRDGRPPASGPDRLSNVDFTLPIADGPITRGFDDFFGVDVPNYPPYVFLENDRTVGIPSLPSGPPFNRPGPVLPGWDWTDVLPQLTRRTVTHIERAASGGQPYFLYLPLTSPHYPVVPSPSFRGKSGAGDYGDFVVQTDWAVGQILAAVDRSGAAANTLVIFTSDNGPEVTGEVNPGVYDRVPLHAHSSAGPLRGAKRDLWEGGHRVPFLARWPGTIPSAATSEETVSHVDLFATVAGLLGADLPADAAPDSFNILPALLGQSPAEPLRPFTIHHGVRGDLAIRQGDWVLIDAPSGDNNREPDWRKREWDIPPHDFPGELFHLKDDPQQHRNLYRTHPGKVRELKALLDQAVARGRTTPGPELPNDTPRSRAGQAADARSNASPAGPWRTGDVLSAEDAPAVARRAFRVAALVTPDQDHAEGVILAHGGALHGYALYAAGGKLTFAVRIQGQLASVSTGVPAPGQTTSIEAALSADGFLKLRLAGQEVARAASPGLIASHPGDPLSVGRDLLSPVGAYPSPYPFQGTVQQARVLFPAIE